MDQLSGLVWVRLPQLLIGNGALEQLGSLVNKLGGRKVLIVTDHGIIQAGLLDHVKAPLNKANVLYGIFDQCQPDAPLGIIRQCAEWITKGQYDLLIGVGGGSVIDTVKMASIIAAEEVTTLDGIRQYIGVDRIQKRGLPNIQIPTTAGTGAEVSWAAMITDEADGTKKPVISEHLFPNVAIIDPLMTLNLPPRVTADTGFDALTHAIEAYTTNRANILSDLFSEKAIKMILSGLRLAYSSRFPEAEARYHVAVGSTLALASMVMAGGALLSHGMAHALQAKAHCTHGASCSIVLPPTMEYNLITNLPKYARLADLMDEKTDGLSLREAAGRAIEGVRRLSSDLGLPQKLQDVGIKEEDIDDLVGILFATQGRPLSNNPRDCSREDATRIYKAVLL
jgi:alcohol dehydrogenase class IV